MIGKIYENIKLQKVFFWKVIQIYMNNFMIKK